MNADERTTRWIAHLLGELAPDESAAVEAEMLKDPKGAAEVRRIVDTTRSWAKQPVAHPPIDMDALMNEARGPQRVATRRIRLRTALPWALAASLLIVAITQASVSATLGGTTIAWGDAQAPSEEVLALQAELTSLNESYIALANENLLFYDQFDDVVFGLQQLETQLQVTATELARSQQRESQTRYTDMQRLLEIAQLTSAALPQDSRGYVVPASYTDRP